VKVPLVRFTVRRMMVAVVGVAVVLGGGIEAIRISRLRAAYLAEAFWSDENDSHLAK
jgi:hypothetical protein